MGSNFCGGGGQALPSAYRISVPRPEIEPVPPPQSKPESATGLPGMYPVGSNFNVKLFVFCSVVTIEKGQRPGIAERLGTIVIIMCPRWL